MKINSTAAATAAANTEVNINYILPFFPILFG